STACRRGIAAATEHWSDFELLGKIAEQLMAALGDHDDILMPDAACARPVNSGLDRENLPRPKGRRSEARILMDLETQSMAGSMEEPLPPTVFDLGAIAARFEERLDFFVDFSAL